MDNQTPPRARKGCSVKLRHIATGREVSYTLVSSLYRERKHWQSPSEAVISPVGVLSVQSPLGSALLGRTTGEIVKGYQIVEINSTVSTVKNLDDYYEIKLQERENGLRAFLAQLERGGWFRARFLRVTPVYNLGSEPGCLRVSKQYESVNDQKYLSSLFMTNKTWRETKKYLALVIFYLGSDMQFSDYASAEILLDRSEVVSLSKKKALPHGLIREPEKEYIAYPTDWENTICLGKLEKVLETEIMIPVDKTYPIKMRTAWGWGGRYFMGPSELNSYSFELY